jgi:hypothetical protein
MVIIKKISLVGFFLLSVVLSTTGLYFPQTETRLQGDQSLMKWRPGNDYSGIRYVGSTVCAQCHANKVASQSLTPMAKALSTGAECQILLTYPQLQFQNGNYTYTITRQGNRSLYTVSDGVSRITETILYCFGQGVSGQTYLFQHNGFFYESRVSFYTELKKLDITTQHSRAVPASLEEALGRPMSHEAARGCFACHSTAAVKGTQLQLETLVPGVTCEACHGPGERHVAAVKTKNYKDPQIFNPKKLDALDQMQEYCGACHQSFESVLQLPGRGGLNNLRFQPYRLANSRGHFINDRRISCVACHDPHDNLQRETAYYDAKCLACHLLSSNERKTETRQAAACPVSKQQCTTCHMPKVEIPDFHTKLTDHWIRIVKPGDNVPN